MNKNLKVCFLINQIFEGGAERVVCNLANFFISQRIETHVITTFRFDGEYFLDKNVKRASVYEDKVIDNFLKKNTKIVSFVKKYCATNKIDCLISFMAESNFRAAFIKKRIDAKVIISIRNDPGKEYNTKTYRYLAKRLFKNVDGIVFQLPDAKSFFSEKIRRKGVVIPNPISKSFLMPTNIIPIDKRSNIVAVGRLTEPKNHKLLIDSFLRANSQIHCELHIYGDGPLKQTLFEYIKSKGAEDTIFLKGKSADLELELQKYKLFVLPSNYEGLPNALMEAMALGIECISTDCPCGGPHFLFQGGIYGELCSVGSQKELADLIVKKYLEKTETKRVEMIKRRANEFSIEQIGKLWIDYIYTICR